MQVLREEFIAVRFVLEFGHDLWRSIVQGKDTVIAYPFVIYKIHLSQDHLMFKCIVAYVHCLLREFADGFAIFGHCLISIRLLGLLFLCCSIYNPPQLNLSHVHFFHHQISSFHVLYRQINKVLLFGHLFPFATLFNLSEVEGLTFLVSRSSVQGGLQIDGCNVPADLFQRLVVGPES